MAVRRTAPNAAVVSVFMRASVIGAAGAGTLSAISRCSPGSKRETCPLMLEVDGWFRAGNAAVMPAWAATKGPTRPKMKVRIPTSWVGRQSFEVHEPIRSSFEYLEGGDALDEFLRQFLSIERGQAIALL